MNLCEEKTFRETFEKWQLALQRYVQSRGFAMDIAANITQETFLRLWKNCAQVELSTVKSYLFKIGNNLMVDHHRAHAVRLKFKAGWQQKQHRDDPQFQLEVTEFRAHFEKVLQKMPDKQREVFMLHRFNDLSYVEIAELLNLSVKAIEKRMSKALFYLSQQNILKKR